METPRKLIRGTKLLFVGGNVVIVMEDVVVVLEISMTTRDSCETCDPFERNSL